jgi:heterodisulfide reductase subunit D
MPQLTNEILRCLDCGKCTSICPVARRDRTYSPRRLINQLIAGRTNSTGDALWSCLTCMLCDSKCPMEVTIAGAMPLLRAEARENGAKPPFTRCSAMQTVAVLQSQAELPQDRLSWLPSDVRTDPKSKTMLFVGCLPFFDQFFTDTKPGTVQAAIGAIRILNALGIEPAILPEERCCGHDALWTGDQATFERLARMNLDMIDKVKPELIVTVCPECSLTLGRDYREHFGGPSCDVKHIAEIIAENAENLPLEARPIAVTFQDPCRMGRHQGKYDEPRAALAAVPELELREMAHSRERATCCAGSWMTCNQATKRIQHQRLGEAVATGGELLVTACPKCMVHLKCAQSGNEKDSVKIEIRDLAALVADALKEK